MSQIKDGRERPIAYASRTLSRAETNYSTIEKGLLGVIFAIEMFRCYIYGTTKFTIITAHRAIKKVLTLRDPNSRLTRWALTFFFLQCHIRDRT